jgi:hypothetical protein
MTVINMDGSPFDVSKYIAPKKAIIQLTEAVEALISHSGSSLLGNTQSKLELK